MNKETSSTFLFSNFRLLYLLEYILQHGLAILHKFHKIINTCNTVSFIKTISYKLTRNDWRHHMKDPMAPEQLTMTQSLDLSHHSDTVIVCCMIRLNSSTPTVFRFFICNKSMLIKYHKLHRFLSCKQPVIIKPKKRENCMPVNYIKK